MCSFSFSASLYQPAGDDQNDDDDDDDEENDDRDDDDDDDGDDDDDDDGYWHSTHDCSCIAALRNRVLGRASPGRNSSTFF